MSAFECRPDAPRSRDLSIVTARHFFTGTASVGLSIFEACSLRNSAEPSRRAPSPYERDTAPSSNKIRGALDPTRETRTVTKLTAVAAAALLTLTVQGTAHAQMSGLTGVQSAQTDQLFVHKTGRRGGRIAAGIALGVLSAAAIAHGSRHYYDDRDDWRHERRCRRWMYRCEDGDRRSCWKFDRRC
jgi:hypothetical protein